MKKLGILLVLVFCVNTLFSQNETSNNRQIIDRKQGKINLDASKGFGKFIFGTPVKTYKNFKYITEPNEPSKRYTSKIPVNYNGIMIKSANLEFYKNKLFSITMHIDKSEVEKLISYCLRNYGPKGRDLDDDGSYFWRGKIKNITIYEIENNEFEVLFIDDTDTNKRMAEASKIEFN